VGLPFYPFCPSDPPYVRVASQIFFADSSASPALIHTFFPCSSLSALDLVEYLPHPDLMISLFPILAQRWRLLSLLPSFRLFFLGQEVLIVSNRQDLRVFVLGAALLVAPPLWKTANYSAPLPRLAVL